MVRFRCFEDERHTARGRKTWYDICTVSHAEARKPDGVPEHEEAPDPFLEDLRLADDELVAEVLTSKLAIKSGAAWLQLGEEGLKEALGVLKESGRHGGVPIAENWNASAASRGCALCQLTARCLRMVGPQV